MTFDENTLRSVIEEVLKEMGEVSGTAAPAAAPVAAAAGKLTITENGEARKGTAADEVVIGLAPAFLAPSRLRPLSTCPMTRCSARSSPASRRRA